MLLIVTNKADLASDYLIARLNERDIPFERINTEDYGVSYSLDVSVDHGDADFELRVGGREPLRKSSILAAYLRQPIEPEVGDSVEAEHEEFARREVLESLRSVWRLIDDDRWLNSPKALLTATNKIEQLSAARRLGLSVPPTCVSADPGRIRDFAEKHDRRIVAKAVRHGFSRQSGVARVVPTQVVTEEMLANLERYAAIPCIWQQHIEKQADLRVTVVGDHVFATAIHSQAHPETRTDWRLCDLHALDLEHARLDLPPQIEDGCRAITRSFGLRYSAIDMVLTPWGHHVFLEMNPNGQWAWIEAKTGYPIRDALIETLGL